LELRARGAVRAPPTPWCPFAIPRRRGQSRAIVGGAYGAGNSGGAVRRPSPGTSACNPGSAPSGPAPGFSVLAGLASLAGTSLQHGRPSTSSPRVTPRKRRGGGFVLCSITARGPRRHTCRAPGSGLLFSPPQPREAGAAGKLGCRAVNFPLCRELGARFPDWNSARGVLGQPSAPPAPASPPTPNGGSRGQWP
jgi:hypothetical protein